ncbi:3-isopropylmalate dehydratase large subunit [Neisseria macacae ATCC 33926]|uniref:3-isopropylmalate dehydratase large subunit n=1 Tax=Neisseria macacae ATCC 33926 TaxID=997348 RepID=A0AA36XIS8_9NEIS|nr:3-isopropylmalate dehydratase large subunit [Neisseria macacae ATCC 33926]
MCHCISTAPCNNRIRRIKQTERSSENCFQTTFPFAPALPSGSEWNQAEQAWREIVDV